MDYRYEKVQTEENGKEDHHPKEAVSPTSADHEDKKKKEEKPPLVGVFEVFRFSDWKDRLLMFFGSLCSIINGAALPGMIIVYGNMIDKFVQTGKIKPFLDSIDEYMQFWNITTQMILKNADIAFSDANYQLFCDNVTDFYENFATQKKNISCPEISFDESILDVMTDFAIYYCIIGGGVLLCSYYQVALWMMAAERQAHRIRQEFLKNVMRQDIGWFDTNDSAQLTTRLADDVTKIQEGIGDKVGTLLQWFFSFVTGFVIGFYYGWKLTLVIISLSPFLAVAAGTFAKLASRMTEKELAAYAKAGAVAEEVFGSIRTVVAFGGQDKETKRYSENLAEAEAFGVKKGFTHGAAMGFIMFVIMCCYALGFWYGGKLIREDDNYDVANMIVVFFSVIIGAFSLGNAAPSIQTLADARGAAYSVFGTIDLKSAIDSSSTLGECPASLRGTIEFRNVNFFYPSRADVQVLNGMSLEVQPGQTVALVGASGCGKSTTVQLLLRFYDPKEGQILIDGKDIKQLNVKWLRRNIGLVSQEPVLFAQNIAENIRYGREDVTMDEIVQATKNANAYDFIMNLPQKFDTLVGERGAQLSGGQKQRVAIARALVRNPKILLLDEATSALDTESESIVQDALDKARQGRTTLIIAHRLSTIKTADLIIGIDKGVAIEKGNHADLMAKGGIYHQLVTNQSKDTAERTEEGIPSMPGALPSGRESIAFESSSTVGSSSSSYMQDKELQEVVAKMSEQKKFNRSISAVKSQVSEVNKEKEEKEEDEKLPDAPFMRLMAMNSAEWHYIVLGSIGATINGGVRPAFAIIFSEIIGIFSKSYDEQEKWIRIYALIFVGLGVVSLITSFMEGYFFGKSGERLTSRLRKNTFKSMMRQDIAWYDDHKNSVGALTTRLATDASLVQGVTGVRLGGVFMSIANLGTAIIIAFVYGWKLTLLILAFMPFLVVGGFMQIKLLAGQAGKNKEALEGAGKIATESIDNIRTVASLSKEQSFFELYMIQLNPPYKAALRKAHLVGFLFAFSQATIYFAYAAAFVFGAYLIEEDEMNYQDVFLVFSCIVFGAMGLGKASAFAPDVGKAKTSAKRILHLLDSKPTIDYTCTDGDTLPANYKAELSFRGVQFCYPTRPSVTVLNDLSLSVSPGQTVALVGSSGCGKSTSVALLERFYDPAAGSVCLDNVDIKSLNIQWLRSQMGIVSQEPMLFDCSIAANIAYGDNSRTVSMDEIISAAKGANIHNFISSLPDGYNTNVGAKGTQLSGGQKQRVAIARALVRNPKILLLDEATSALDTESEKIVQEALDSARQGRTCVVIAHRLSTIKTADMICVVSQGRVTEAGTHSQLMANQRFYYRLVHNSTRH